MKYHRKFVNTLGRIQHIALMSRLGICYETCRLATQTVAHILPGFQCIKRCVEYLASHPHKPIFYPYNKYDGSYFIRLIWSVNQVEQYTTQSFLEFHQDADHARILNRRWSVSGIIHTLTGVSIFWKVYIQPAIAYDSTYGDIRCVYKAFNKTKYVCRYMEALALHIGSPTVHWEDNTRCTSVDG